MTEPTIVGTKPLLRGEELRVSLEHFKGARYLNIRKWYRDGTMKPGKGVTVRVDNIPFLVAALAQAEAIALERGLLEEEDFELAGREIPPELLGEAA